ncbi:MAG: HD domain-containing protein [Thermodesulfobacteriota bacterium]|nr:MAG: HD domain-containing protein [Thermodesulfobacteriota bacterium]
MNRGEEKGSAGKKGRKERALFFVDLDRLKQDHFIGAVYGCALKAVSNTSPTPLFLVGGVVRDLLLGKPIPFDYDFVCAGGAESLARSVAIVLGGTAFLLDKKEGLYRVAVKGDYPRTIDIAPLKYKDISTDLKARDFTVNAMAVDLAALYEGAEDCLLDPTGGMDDCFKKRLRHTGPRVFDEDPLRCMRGVRIAARCGLEIQSGTRTLIKEKSALLSEKKTSPERIRDELFLIFSGPGTAGALKELFEVNIIKAVIPEFKGWSDVNGYDLLGHTLKTVTEAERLLEYIEEESPDGFPPGVKIHFRESAGITGNATVLKLAAFLHDAGKPLTMAHVDGRLRFIGHEARGAELVSGILKRLKTSRKVRSRVTGLVRNHHRVFNMAALDRPTHRAFAHFFRAAGGADGEDGIDLVMLALADARATRGCEDRHLFALTRKMVAFYFDEFLKKRPRPLLNGREIMETFGLEEGRLVGQVMEKISEGVETGAVRNRDEAVEYIKDWLSKGNP